LKTEIEDIIGHFESYVSVSEALRTALIARLKLANFKKGDLILDAKNVCTQSYFINAGIMRTYFMKDDKEVTEYFTAEKEWVNSPKSFILQIQDIYYIDAIEDVTAFSLSTKELVYLFDHFPEMERYARLSMGSGFGHLLERIRSMRFTTAKEKYDHFISIYSEIYPRLPLGMVASYLGITQETLSRIRSPK